MLMLISGLTLMGIFLMWTDHKSSGGSSQKSMASGTILFSIVGFGLMCIAAAAFGWQMVKWCGQ